MKRKLFLAVIAVLVLCLTCSMLLVACNDDKPGPDDGTPPVVPPEDELSAADALAQIVQNLDEVATDTTNNKEFNFGLEIVDKGNGGNVIFGLATEKYDGKDYLYGAINGPYKKFNGFDLGATVQTILGWFGEKIEIPIGKLLGGTDQTLILDAENVINLSSTLAGMVLTKNVKAQNGGYMVELDLAKVVGLVNTATSGSGGIDGLTEPYADTISTVLNVVNSVVDLGIDADASVSEILNSIASKFQVLVYFGFDGAADADKETNTSDPFGGLMRGVLAARETTATNLINFKGQIKIDAVDLTEVPATEEGKAPTYTEKVVNNYVLDIVVDLDPFVALGLLDLVDSNKDLTKLEIKFKDFTVSDITAMLTEFGYMHISLDKMVDGKVDKNLFTLHYDSAENAAVAAAALVNKINGEDFAIGGVYNIDALGGLIDKLIKDAKPQEPAPDENAGAETTAECTEHVDANKDCVCDTCGAAIAHVDVDGDCACDTCGAAVHVDADGDCVCDKCTKEYHPDADNNGICDNQKCKKIINLMALIGHVYGNIDQFYFINDTTKAITINVEKIGEFVLDLLLKNPGWDNENGQAPIIMRLIPEVLGAGALRISVAEGAFGFANVVAADHIAMKDLVCDLRNDASFGENANVYMESINSINGDLTAGSKVKVTGVAFDGTTEVTLDGIIMDAVTTGEGENATTTYYVGILTDLAVNEAELKAIIASIDPNIWTNNFEIPANWPFYGVLAYTPTAA